MTYLNRSSNACLALVLEPPDEVPPASRFCGVLVWRSMVVRGSYIVQLLRTSFGATRAGSRSLLVHSHRALVSNDTHCTQLCRSTPHLAQRLSSAIGSASRLPQRAQRQTSCAAIRFGVFGPAASCS